MLTFKKIITLSVLLLATVVIASGCAEKAALKAIEESTGVKVEEKDKEITITSKEGQEIKLGGESGKLPEGLPLPAFPGAKVDSSLTSKESDGKHYVVSLSSPKPFKELVAFYEDALKAKGITPEKTEMIDETSSMVILNGKAGNLDANVQIYEGESIGQEGFVINIIAKVAE
jgi:hypothetical protein